MSDGAKVIASLVGQIGFRIDTGPLCVLNGSSFPASERGIWIRILPLVSS